ncbi:CoA transferase [Chromohalobacter japonicus]|uniref:CoA transferase n=1 Tax=Chromohalobacter japonicus TaxID=223900 RepID=A0A1Q8TFB8_9GAMM|nr:CoA transferase [Chromohalobacter japonicus]OLO12379.1 CoA transferase [Chromohalobacter japonicus]
MTTQTLPLTGYRILDLTMVTSGPVGTMMLADMGADVIKVEPLKNGELSRSMGTTYVNGENRMFLSQNRNKRSIRIDLKSQAGRETFLRLASEADVITENFRPGTVDRLGIDYEAVKAVNPRIVYASISAFGQTGPYAAQPANDPIVQALSGLMAMTGEPDRPPSRIGSPYPDFGAAALLAFAVSTALLHRERTGEGQQLDISLLNGAIFSCIPRDGETLATGAAPSRMGSGHPTFAPYRSYQGADGQYFFLACFTEKFWNALCDALDNSKLSEDDRFRTNALRCENREALDATLADIFHTQETAHWVNLFKERNVPSAPIQDLHQALTQDPQVAHNNTVIEMEHPTAGTVPMLSLPVNFHGTPARYQNAPPRLGEHTAEILSEFGFSDEECQELFARSIAAGMDDGEGNDHGI